MLRFQLSIHSPADQQLYSRVTAAFQDNHNPGTFTPFAMYNVQGWPFGVRNYEIREDFRKPFTLSVWEATNPEAELWLLANIPAEAVQLPEDWSI